MGPTNVPQYWPLRRRARFRRTVRCRRGHSNRFQNYITQSLTPIDIGAVVLVVLQNCVSSSVRRLQSKEFIACFPSDEMRPTNLGTMLVHALLPSLSVHFVRQHM